jgi:transaldolase
MSDTADLAAAGQSLWVDNITRELLDTGVIQQFADEFSVTGLTSNPSIFDKAITDSTSYDAQIKSLAKEGVVAEECFFELAIDDLRRAADIFRPVHDATNGLDGWVSLEVSPELADDAPTTIAAAKKLHAQAGKKNLFIKIPGTPAGLVAIEETIAAGVPVNVTLLFSTEHYLAAADAYTKGLERRLAAGQDLNVCSVASLFISRWDVAVAKEVPGDLKDKLGIAIGADAYAAYRTFIASERVQKLVAAGAPIQRLLFASTGTKDPDASDTLYIQGLAAPETINTMPDGTLRAFHDHGVVTGVLAADGGDSAEVFAAITDAGVDLDVLAARLQDEGKTSFVSAWKELLDSIEQKAK